MNNFKKRDRREDPSFIGRIDARKMFDSVVRDNEINADTVAKLWKVRQEKTAYIQTVRVDYHLYKRMRPYLDAYMAEFDRLILDSIGTISSQESILPLEHWN